MDDDTDELEAADELDEQDFARYLERFKQKFPNANYTPELVETIRAQYDKLVAEWVAPPEAALEAEPEAALEEPETDDDPSLAKFGMTQFRTEEWDRDLPSIEKLLFLALIGHCGVKKNWCVVSHERLAKDISAHVDTVIRKLKSLKAKRLVIIKQHQVGNVNRYTLPGLDPIHFGKSKAYWNRNK
jgi:hypothetical protein